MKTDKHSRMLESDNALINRNKKTPIPESMDLPSSSGTQSSSLSVVARCTFQTINIVLVLVSEDLEKTVLIMTQLKNKCRECTSAI